MTLRQKGGIIMISDDVTANPARISGSGRVVGQLMMAFGILVHTFRTKGGSPYSLFISDGAECSMFSCCACRTFSFWNVRSMVLSPARFCHGLCAADVYGLLHPLLSAPAFLWSGSLYARRSDSFCGGGSQVSLPPGMAANF